MCTSKPSIESSFIAYLGRVTAKKFTIRFSVGLLQIFAIFETNFEGSSTVIRNRIFNYLENTNKINLGINGLTTNSVIKYIIENKLYKINQ